MFFRWRSNAKFLESAAWKGRYAFRNIKKSNPRQNKAGALGDDAGRGKLCKRLFFFWIDCQFIELRFADEITFPNFLGKIFANKQNPVLVFELSNCGQLLTGSILSSSPTDPFLDWFIPATCWVSLFLRFTIRQRLNAITGLPRSILIWAFESPFLDSPLVVKR